MSKFKIFRSSHNDPKKMRKQNRKLIIGYSFLFLLTMLTINSNIFKKLFVVSMTNYIIILFILISITLFFVIKIRKQSKQMLQIGTLEFTKTCIKKVIGDLKTEYDFNKILKIELEQHLQAITVFESKSGYLTYIVKIIQRDFKEDQFIVSEKSIDFGQKISLVDTFKTLEKISDLDIMINKN